MSRPPYLELGVPNGSRARDFYAALFGWTFKDMGKDNFFSETSPLWTGLHCGDDRACFVVYFAVDDIGVAVQRVRELGGQADEPSPEQAGFGRFAECKDTQGVLFGLRQLPKPASP